MKKKLFKLFPIFLSLILFFTSSLSVCASSTSDTPFNINGTSFKGYTKATAYDKFQWTWNNLVTFVGDSMGIFLSAYGGGGVDVSAFKQSWTNFLIEKEIIKDSDSMQDYLNSHISVNEEETEITMDATLSDDLHDALKQYLDTNTPYIYYQTTKYTDVPAQYFETGTTYKAFKTLVESKDSGTLFYINNNARYHVSGAGSYYGCAYIIPSSYGLIYQTEYELSPQDPNNWYNYGFYNDDWVLTQITPTSFSNADFSTKADNKANLYLYKSTDIYINNSHIITKNGSTVKLWKTLGDWKNCDVGQQPYYTSSKWNNYVSGQGNTITQQEFNAPVTYENIVNNITGDTTITNGISEEQLQALVDAIIKSNSGGSGGSGSGDSGGSGGGSSDGGLSDLLSGLGALGDVILSVLGKLSEYLGKAMALFSDVILGIIDKVPKGFTDLLSAFFPFIPEEWTIAVGLGIVLTIILGIVRIFKK